MTFNKRILTVIVLSYVLTVFLATSIFAQVCTPVNKLPGADSVGVYNIVTETILPDNRLSPNMTDGGFVTFTDGQTFAVDIIIHQLLPEGAWFQVRAATIYETESAWAFPGLHWHSSGVGQEPPDCQDGSAFGPPCHHLTPGASLIGPVTPDSYSKEPIFRTTQKWTFSGS